MAVWKNAVTVAGPSGALTPQMQPPIRITKVVKPVRITETGKDTFIVDMGQNFAGVATHPCKSSCRDRDFTALWRRPFSGWTVELPNTVAGQTQGDLASEWWPGAPKTAWQQDSYIAKGNGVEEWAPRFTFHGFRYVEITGWTGTPTLNDIEGLRMNTDVQPAGTLPVLTTCSTSCMKSFSGRF